MKILRAIFYMVPFNWFVSLTIILKYEVPLSKASLYNVVDFE